MIHSTGNNFGCGPIALQDFQSGSMAVLNGTITIDTASPEYAAAQVLEITLPELSIPRSCVTSCWMRSLKTVEYPGYTRTYSIGTAVRTWLRDSRTLCIERLPIYDDLGSVTLVLSTMYAVRGVRRPVLPGTNTDLTLEYLTEELDHRNVVCAVEDGLCFLHICFDEFTSEFGDSVSIRLRGFPEDVSADLCLTGGSNNTGHPGSAMAAGRVEGGVLTVPDLGGMSKSTGWTPFIFMFAPRGGTRQGNLLSNP